MVSYDQAKICLHAVAEFFEELPFDHEFEMAIRKVGQDWHLVFKAEKFELTFTQPNDISMFLVGYFGGRQLSFRDSGPSYDHLVEATSKLYQTITQ